MKKLSIIILITLSLFLNLFIACENDEENIAPSCTIISPNYGDVIQKGQTVPISIDVNDKDGYITDVHFYINSINVISLNSSPFNYNWETANENTGSYTISVTAFDNKGAETSNEVRIDLIGISPKAEFSFNPTEGYLPLSIEFIDQSINEPTSWFWDFGDENTSDTKSPNYIYNSLGTFSVTLIVSNEQGADTIIKGNIITTDYNVGNCEDCQTGSVSDIDDNIYKTVKIGNQWWMAENLKTTHYSDGRTILYIEDNDEWDNLDPFEYDKAYCYFDNDPSIQGGYNGAYYTYGAAADGNNNYYNAYPENIQGVCPDGWHLPSEYEWEELFDYAQANSSDIGAKALRATTGYIKTNGTDEFGFSAFWTDCRKEYGIFNYFGVGEDSFWWSTSTVGGAVARAYVFGMSDGNTWSDLRFESEDISRTRGYPVRCVKD